MSFKYRDFTLDHDRSAMKIGSDSLALGEWMDIKPSDRSLLDVGTGCGILSLMAASRAAEASSGALRSDFQITAIDIDPESVMEAAANFAASSWSMQIAAQCRSLQSFAAEEAAAGRRFDLIFSNPPYYPEGLQAPDARRNLARRCETLTFRELIDGVLALLAPDGRFALCLPEPQARDFVFYSAPAGLHPRRREIRSYLSLMELGR